MISAKTIELLRGLGYWQREDEMLAREVLAKTPLPPPVREPLNQEGEPK